MSSAYAAPQARLQAAKAGSDRGAEPRRPAARRTQASEAQRGWIDRRFVETWSRSSASQHQLAATARRRMCGDASWLPITCVRSASARRVVHTRAIRYNGGLAAARAQTTSHLGHYDFRRRSREELILAAVRGVCGPAAPWAVGTSDDKGQMLGPVKALESWLRDRGKLPVTV